MPKLILTLLLLTFLVPLAHPQGVLRPRSIVIQTTGDPVVTPTANGIYSTDIILLTPGIGTSPREVRLVPGVADETIDLNLSAGDDADDLVRIGLFNNSLNDGWRIVFDQGAVSDVLRIQDHLANDAIIIDQTTLDTSFLSLANITNDHILLAGDNIDDLVRIRMLNLAGTDGWQILFDQGTASDVFRIQDNAGNTALVIDQTNLDTSFQTLPNVLNSLGILAGDAVDDDVRILMENTTGLNGYQIFWDQFPDDELRIEDHTGIDIAKFVVGTVTLDTTVPLTGSDDLGTSGNPWDDIWFDREIAGGGTVGMAWLPDGDGTRDLGTSDASWAATVITNLQVENGSDNVIIELNNTSASATNIRVNDPSGGSRRVNIGTFNSGNDVAVSLLGPTSADNIAITSADAGGTAALQVGGISVVKAQCSSLPVDATDLATVITLTNAMKDCINENNHGLADGT